MTNIKCRYIKSRCTKGSEWFWYDDIAVQCVNQAGCELFEAEDPTEREWNLFCKFIEFKEIEFERNYSRYEYNEDVLKVGSRTIPAKDILYLEIDGRVLIADEQN